MDKLIPVVAMKRCYYEPENRPRMGKLYYPGDKFEVEESRFSDYDKVETTKKGYIVRGAMRRLDKPAPADAPAQKPAGKKG